MLKWTKVSSWFMKYIQVGNQKIGSGQPCFIIAEASSNHGGNFRRAKRMIDVAAEAGADAVKFQVFTAQKSAVDTKDSRVILKKGVFVDKDTSLAELLREIEMPRNWLPKLAAHAQKRRIIFFATPADLEAIDQLEAIGVLLYKIGSYEMQDVMLLRRVARTNKPIILSTGMNNLQEIAVPLRILYKAGNSKVALLHCRSTYPLPSDQVDLRAMRAIRKKYGVPVGFSDHTLGINIPIAAVALGANIIEKHFMLDDGMHTVDDKFSLIPQELLKMVRGVREVEQAMGSDKKRLTEAEKKERIYRRGLWVVEPMQRGELFTEKNVKALQPALGISPLWLDRVLGKKAKGSIIANTPLQRWHF